MSTLTPDMIAVSQESVEKGEVKPLGFITWFTVPDEPVKLNKLKKQWILAGLDPRVLPGDPKAKDTFKRAMREQETRERYFDNAARQWYVTETTVKDVVETPEECVYQINRVVRDTGEKVVEFPKAMLVIFNKATLEIKFKKLGDISRAELLPMMEAITAYYEANAKTITGGQLRTVVRRYIADDFDEQSNTVGLSGENMRGKAGGVYLVLAKYHGDLKALARFLSEIHDNNRAYLYNVPLADGASERELVRRHHTANTVKEIQSEIHAVRELLKGRDEPDRRAVRSNVIEHHMTKLQMLRRRAAQYTEVLKEEQEDIESMAEMLGKQLRALI